MLRMAHSRITCFSSPRREPLLVTDDGTNVRGYGCYVILQEIFSSGFLFSFKIFFPFFQNAFSFETSFLREPLRSKNFYLHQESKEISQNGMMLYKNCTNKRLTLLSFEEYFLTEKFEKSMDCMFPMSAIIEKRGRKLITENQLRFTCTCLLSNVLESIIKQFWGPFLANFQ